MRYFGTLRQRLLYGNGVEHPEGSSGVNKDRDSFPMCRWFHKLIKTDSWEEPLWFPGALSLGMRRMSERPGGGMQVDGVLTFEDFFQNPGSL